MTGCDCHPDYDHVYLLMSCPPGSYGDLFDIGSPVIKKFRALLKQFYETNHIEKIFKAFVALFNIEYRSAPQRGNSSTIRYAPTSINTLDKYLFFLKKTTH